VWAAGVDPAWWVEQRVVGDVGEQGAVMAERALVDGVEAAALDCCGWVLGFPWCQWWEGGERWLDHSDSLGGV
jgi:hypothetical protein